MANSVVLVEVQVRRVYGVDKIYPVNQEAKIFAEIARTATLRPEDIGKIRALGFQVVESYSSRLSEVLKHYANGMVDGGVAL